MRTSFCRLVGRHFLILAKPGDIDLVSRNVELRRKVLYNGRRALLAEFVVVLRTAHRVSAANQLDYIAFGVRNVIAELIESFLGFLAKDSAVEGKVHRGFSHRAIVIQVRDRIRQRVYFAGGLGCSLVSLIGSLSCGDCFLIGSGGFVVHSLDALLGSRVDITNVLRGLRRQIVEFVGFIDYRRSFVAHVLLGGAAGAEQYGGACHWNEH